MNAEWNQMASGQTPSDVRAITLAGTPFAPDEALRPRPVNDASITARKKTEEEAAREKEEQAARERREQMMRMGLLPADAEHAMKANRTRVGRLLSGLEREKSAGNDPVESIGELVKAASAAASILHGGPSLFDAMKEGAEEAISSDEDKKDKAPAPTERDVQQMLNRNTPLPQ